MGLCAHPRTERVPLKPPQRRIPNRVAEVAAE